MTKPEVTVRCWNGNVRPFRGEVRWIGADGKPRLRYTGNCISERAAQRAAAVIAAQVERENVVGVATR